MITLEWVHVPIWCRVDCLIAGPGWGDVFTLGYFKVVDGYILLGVAGLPSIVFTTGPTDGVTLSLSLSLSVSLSVPSFISFSLSISIYPSPLWFCLFAYSILLDFSVAGEATGNWRHSIEHSLRCRSHQI